MRAFVLGVLGLSALYLVTTTGGGRVATALATPTGWLQKWADPTVPLITGTAGASTAPPPASTAAPHPRSGPARPSRGHSTHTRRVQVP